MPKQSSPSKRVVLVIALVFLLASSITAQVGSVPPERKAAAQPYFDRADALFQQGKYEEAIEAYQQGLQLNPSSSGYYTKLGYTYSRSKKSAEAVDAYKKALEIQPDNAEAQARLGYEYQALGNYEESLKAYEKAVRLNPKDSISWAMIGRAHSGLKQYGEAIAAYQKSIQLEFNNGDPYVGLSYAYLETGKNEDVIKAAKLAILYKTQFMPAAYNNLGYAYQALGQYDESVSALKQAIQLDPNYVKAYNNLGRTLFLLGRHQEAIEVLQQAIGRKPDEFSTRMNLADDYLVLGRFEEAAAELEQATLIDPKSARAFITLGLAYNRSAKYEAALEAFAHVIELKPQEADAFISRSYSNLYLGRGHAAAVDARKYLELSGGRNKRDQYACLVAHFGYRQAGETAEARRVLEEGTKTEATTWPYSVIRYLLREITAGQLLAQATDGDKKTEARAYIGTDLLLSGHRVEAKPYLQWVRDNGNKNFVEYALAVAELNRLEKEAGKP